VCCKPDRPGDQQVNDSAVAGNVSQIGSAHVVNIGSDPQRMPLPDPMATPARPGLNNLPRRRARVFVGRDEALARVEQALHDGKGVITQGPQAAVHGLGGIGKSELALQYALRNTERYRLIRWIDADSPAQIQNGLVELTRAIVGYNSAAHAPAEEAVEWAFAWLAAHPGWLLIFDNVEDARDIEPVLNRLNDGAVLITTRRTSDWEDLLCTPINLDVLAADAAVRLLAELIGDSRPVRPGELAALAEDLGWLPLALTQAGAYIAQTPGMTVQRYRRLLRQAPGRAHAAAAVGHDQDRVVARVWEVTLDRIARTNPLAPRLLELLACYAPEFLPVKVLYGLPDADDLDINEALAVLASYSMITLLGEDTVSVHRVVQSVTLARLTPDQRAEVRRLAADLLDAALPEAADDSANWPTYAQLLPHVRVALPPESLAMAKVVRYLGASGDYSTAIELQRLHHSALCKTYGSEHPFALAALAGLTYWIGESGELVAARDQFAALLPICERVLGPKHPDTLFVRAGVARWTGEAGDPAAARRLYAELLPLREQVSKPEDPATLANRASFAFWTGRLGDAATARDLYAQLLPLRERVSGPEHPETLAVRSNLARWTGEAGDPFSARDQYAELLSIRQRVLGPEHPYTLAVRANLARWTGEAGDKVAARDRLAELIPVHERVWGPKHPRTLGVRADLARWIGEAGDKVAARDRLAELIPIYEEVLGATHSDTLAVRVAFARWTGETGDAAAARDQLAELIPVHERVWGPKHPRTLGVRADLAHWTGVAGDAAAARDQLTALIPLYEEVLGATHSDTLAVLARLEEWEKRAVRGVLKMVRTRRRARS